MIFALSWAGQGLAKGVDLKSIPELKPVEFMPTADFESKTKVIEEAPFKDMYIAYGMRLPVDWKYSIDPPKTIPDAKMKRMSDRVLGMLAEYSSPPRLDLRSYMTIEALELTYEINARNWFINYMLSNGKTPTALKEISEHQIEGLYVEIQGDDTFAVRVKAMINGPRVVIVRYFVPQQDFENERVMQAQVINSFHLLNEEIEFIERREKYGFLDQSYFDYPESWKLTAPRTKSIERMRAMLVSGENAQRPDAQMNMYAVSRMIDTSLAAEVDAYRKKLNIPGYAIGDLVESVKFTHDKSVEFSATDVYRMTPTTALMKNYELAITIMQGVDYYYIITLLTPARDEDFYLWARNMRAFRIVAETMRRYDDEGDQYEDVPEKTGE